MTTSHASASGSGRRHAQLWRSLAAGLLSIGLAALIAQTHGQAQGQNPLPYSTGFLVTGNYVVGGVDIQGQSVNGFSTGTIHMSGVPKDADILAAYLYWETIDLPGSANLNPLTTPVKFRGQPVTDANVKVVKGSSVPGIGASQSFGRSVAGSGGALSRASGADNAASCDAATRPGMTD